MVSWPVTGVNLQSLHIGGFPVWFQVLTYNQSSTDISWLVIGVDLELKKGWSRR